MVLVGAIPAASLHVSSTHAELLPLHYLVILANLEYVITCCHAILCHRAYSAIAMFSGSTLPSAREHLLFWVSEYVVHYLEGPFLGVCCTLPEYGVYS